MRSSRSKSRFVATALVLLCAVQSVAIARPASAADPAATGPAATAPASTASAAPAAPAASTATTAPSAAPAAASSGSSSAARDPAEVALGSYWTPRRIAGFMLLGVGVVGVGVGSGVGLQAKSRFDTANNENGELRNTDSAHAVREGNVATAMLITGGVLAAGGLVLWLTAPSAAPQVGTNGTSVFVRGSF